MKSIKITFKLYNLLALLVLIFPLKNTIGQTNDTLISYVSYSLTGPQVNGTFRVEVDTETKKNHVTNMVYSDATDGQYKITEIDFMDIENEGGVYFKIPAQIGLIELTEMNRDKFAFGIVNDDVTLKARSVSFNIEEVVEDKYMKMRLSFIKGKFEGIMEYKYEDNGEKVETYTIHGSFQYISPLYLKKLKSKK
ncbi:MAG: hypothetical protein R2836_10720 [Chitinophagales bacterium]